MTGGSGEPVKILFRLAKDEEGYPPQDVEGLWANPTDDGLFELDNIPFFVQSVASGDVVAASRDGERLYFERVVRPSGHSTIRVMLDDATALTQVREDVRCLGCESERGPTDRLIAVDVPPNADLERVREYLADGAEEGRWDYEEACLARPTSE
jgi:hypothetical protein